MEQAVLLRHSSFSAVKANLPLNSQRWKRIHCVPFSAANELLYGNYGLGFVRINTASSVLIKVISG